MDEYESLSHTKWDCKYHVVFIPKCREERFMENCAHIQERCSASWRSRKRAGSRKVIFFDFDSIEICGLAGGWLHQSAVPDASNSASTNPRPSEARGEAGDRTGHVCCSAIYGLIFSINIGGK